MRKGFSTLLIVLLAQGSFPASSQPEQGARRIAEPLCRRPPALPPLPREVEPQQQQRSDDMSGPVPMPMPIEAPPIMAPPAPPAPPPPPPPPMPAPAMDSADAEIAVTGSRISRPSLESPSPVTTVTSSESAASSAPAAVAPSATPPPEYRGERYAPRSGQLTAGEHDDLLNPELYARYVNAFLRGTQMQGVPRVDTSRVLTVAVQDNSGRPVPFARVTLTCADGNSLSLATMADGTAVFFPGLDRLGSRVRLAVAGGGSRNVDISSAAGGQRQSITVGGTARAATKLDLLLAIDTTGSMGDELDYLKSELRAILARLKAAHRDLDIRLSLVVYRDIGDEYVTRTFPFTSSIEVMQRQLAAQQSNGGGDYPEAMEQALIRAMAQSWRPDAVKSLLLVADAPPHDENIALTWLAGEVARSKRIHVTPIAASGVGDTAEYVMRAMAAASQSRYLFLTDDSGIGNPHAPPAVDCYLVTQLDALVGRVLDSQISGRRVEPKEGEIIRRVGKYDNGKCILPPDFSQQ